MPFASGRAARGQAAIDAEVQLVAAHPLEMGLHLRAAQSRIRDPFVEALHQHVLAHHRQSADIQIVGQLDAGVQLTIER
jgi:hypothetical protein